MASKSRNRGRRKGRGGQKKGQGATQTPGNQNPAAASQPSSTSQPSTNPPAATTRRSAAQKRAEHALEKIVGIAGGDYGNYPSYVKSLPARIIMSGLGQALAAEKAGASVSNTNVSKGHELLFGHVQDWLRSNWEHRPSGSGDILQSIIDGSEADYIRTQGEAMAYLEWLKKFAVAYLKEPEQDGDGDATAAS